MNPNPEFEHRDWQTFHEKAFFVDMHAHPTFPASFFPPRPFLPFVPSYRHANQCDLDHLPDPRAYRGSTIFKFRTAFPLLQAGGADVVLTYTVVPELDFLTAMLGTRFN